MRLNTVPLNTVPLNSPANQRLRSVAGDVAAAFSTTSVLSRIRGVAGLPVSVSFSTTGAADRVKVVGGDTTLSFTATANIQQTHQLAGAVTSTFSTTFDSEIVVNLAGSVTMTFNALLIPADQILGGAVSVSFTPSNSVFEAAVTLGGDIAVSFATTADVDNTTSYLYGAVNVSFSPVAYIAYKVGGVGPLIHTSAGHPVVSFGVTGDLLVNSFLAGEVTMSITVTGTGMFSRLDIAGGAVGISFSVTATLSPIRSIFGEDIDVTFTPAAPLGALRFLGGAAVWSAVLSPTPLSVIRVVGGAVTTTFTFDPETALFRDRGLAGDVSASFGVTGEPRVATTLFGAVVIATSIVNSDFRVAARMAGAVSASFIPAGFISAKRHFAGAVIVTFGPGATMFPNPGEPAPLNRIIFVEPKDRDIFVEPKDTVILFLPDDDGGTVDTKQKQPSEVVDYDVDLRTWFGEGPLLDEIQTIVLTVDTGSGTLPDLQFGPNALPDYSLVGDPKWVAKVWVGGGLNGIKYKCTAVITTMDGRVEEVDWFVNVKEQ